MKSARRILLVLAALLAFPSLLLAVKAWPYPVTVAQPDGSMLVLRIVGDENWSYKTTLAGRPVYQDAQGFWHETDSLPARPAVRKQLSPEGGALAAFFSTKASVSVRRLVIPVQFSDRTFSVPNPRSSIYNLFNQQNYAENGATGSVLDYFRDNLDNRGQLLFDVCDVVTLPYTMRYYGENADGVTDRNLRQLVQHACIAADAAGVDFSQYDFNKDGFVDNVFLIVAGHNEAEGGGDYTIWPQSWNISDAGLSIDGKRLSNFSVCSELAGASGYRFTGIGTICHEFCHFLGLPDLYDVNDATEGEGPGLCGTLSVMDQGNYNNEGRTPPFLTVFERNLIGLTTTIPIRAPRYVSIAPVQNTAQAWVLPTTVSGEEFWLEYRTGARWDAYIGGRGLVVYHIDRSGNAAGSMPARMRWETNAVNGCAAHPCAQFVASTGESPASVADAFYPGVTNVRSIYSSTNFPLLAWNGQGIGLGITEISISVEGMSCRIVNDNAWDLPVVT
ncbi:MAG: M6 family metalloprotease domain-containing protein, partial [Bacteroidales bacterium]|nr:M6 family metalloprotease domain-containing protein [Bacteroidales bacterium]